MPPGIALDPTFAGAASNLATVLKALGRFDEAVEFYGRALRLLGISDAEFAGKPPAGPPVPAAGAQNGPRGNVISVAEVYSNLATVLQNQGRLDEAMVAFDRAIQRANGTPITASNRLFCMQYLPTITPESLLAQCRLGTAELRGTIAGGLAGARQKARS